MKVGDTIWVASWDSVNQKGEDPTVEQAVVCQYRTGHIYPVNERKRWGIIDRKTMTSGESSPYRNTAYGHTKEEAIERLAMMFEESRLRQLQVAADCMSRAEIVRSMSKDLKGATT
jgi:hypothetical protein